MLLDMLMGLPILLPVYANLLTDPQGQNPPDLHTLRLAGWMVSGKRSKQREFQSRLQLLLKRPRDLTHALYTHQSGKFFVCGVLNTMLIPFTHL